MLVSFMYALMRISHWFTAARIGEISGLNAPPPPSTKATEAGEGR